MPIYVFENEQGEQVDKYYPMANAPIIGQVVHIDGQAFTRIPHFNLDTGGISRKTHGYPRVSRTLPANYGNTVSTPDCDTDRAGRPILRSPEHERQVLKRMGWEREGGDGLKVHKNRSKAK